MKTNKSFVILTCFVLLVVILAAVNISAIVAKIGNGKMILSVEKGDVIERSIRVINDNNISVNITLFSAGDLKDDTKIIDESFILSPGEEKNARFSINITKDNGTYTTKINVQFTPIGENNTLEKNGAGLSSTIITKVGDGGNNDEIIEDRDNQNDFKLESWMMVLMLTTLLLVVVLLLLLYYSRKKRKKGVVKVNNGGKK